MSPRLLSNIFQTQIMANFGFWARKVGRKDGTTARGHYIEPLPLFLRGTAMSSEILRVTGFCQKMYYRIMWFAGFIQETECANLQNLFACGLSYKKVLDPQGADCCSDSPYDHWP